MVSYEPVAWWRRRGNHEGREGARSLEDADWFGFYTNSLIKLGQF
jgi:hypothetical protein